MNLAAESEELYRCSRCGFCQAHCPIFRATGREEGVARGRLTMLEALLSGELPWTREVEEPLFTCLLCGACTANCFPAVRVADLVKSARRDFLERAGRKPFHRLLFDHLLPYPGRLRLAARAAATAQKREIDRLAGALRLLRFLGPDFPETINIPGRLPGRGLRDRITPQTLPGQGELSIAYFTGCGMDIVLPDAASETIKLLQKAGRTVDVLNNCCCGLPADTYGDRRVAQRLAEKNIRVLTAKPYDLIVTDCSSCASFLKKYPDLFPENDWRREEAARAVSKIRDLVELSELLPGARPAGGQKTVVTYHDPCHAVRGQGLKAEPREILKSLPGVEYREMNEADWCCGGAGSYALGHYKLAQQVLDRKLDNIVKSGADVVATSCPACIIHLDYGCRRRNIPVKVVHISQVVKDHTG